LLNAEGRPLAAAPLACPSRQGSSVDAQSSNQLAVIDPATRTVIRRVRLPGCSDDHGSAGRSREGRWLVRPDAG